MRKSVETHATDISVLAYAQMEYLKSLNNTISNGLSEIASCLEWGFGELNWQLQQQTDVLRSIDQTLKTPGETQANEFRMMAEELRRRGVLDESEEFYLKALELNRLDYRLYIGLAETYLQMNEFSKAKVFLEKSLPHAPNKEINYKSYSYRLIGHIHACEEDYSQAVTVLHSSIELSPSYEDGHYDYAQCCAQIGNTKSCLNSLQKAILGKPIYWYLSQKEKNFDPIKEDVLNLLEEIKQKAHNEAHKIISKAKAEFNASENFWHKFVSLKNDRPIIQKINKAMKKVASNDYESILESKSIGEKVVNIALKTKSNILTAESAASDLKEKRDNKIAKINM